MASTYPIEVVQADRWLKENKHLKGDALKAEADKQSWDDSGAFDYVVDGKMIGGFALVAYPADYRNSGVMTFLVNHAGTVFQKDLGPDTRRLAERMPAFNPDSTWQKVTDTSPVP
ncbi:MAG: DUF2950 family protein [Xanthobacteraceae bacterium]|nr:DUF2950 family protein [Xanthobacteraceae bacterium]